MGHFIRPSLVDAFNERTSLMINEFKAFRMYVLSKKPKFFCLKINKFNVFFKSVGLDSRFLKLTF